MARSLDDTWLTWQFYLVEGDTNMNLRNERIIQSELAVKQAQAAFEQAVKEVQQGCTHPNIGEGPGEPFHDNVVRVCMECGLSATSTKGDYGVLGPADKLVFKLTSLQIASIARKV